MRLISEALAHATAYWHSTETARPGQRAGTPMPARAAVCASILGRSTPLKSLTASHGAQLLKGLSDKGLSRASIASYYAAGRRMLALAGSPTHDWPNSLPPPRIARKPVTPEEIDLLMGELAARGWEDTCELVLLMRDTGMRVNIEALRGEWHREGDRLYVTSGKGGHQRMIPYKGTCRGPLMGVTYETHLRRIIKAGEAVGRPDLRPHDLRRAFVKRVYERSGRDLRVAQVLAGHADPGTTAGYIGVSEEELAQATS
jgi:integrase